MADHDPCSTLILTRASRYRPSEQKKEVNPMQGLARFAGWVGVLALLWFLGWKVVMLLAPGVTLGGVATTLLIVNVMAGAFAFLFGVGLFVLYVLSELSAQPASRRVEIKK
jgi:hypothetical protein